MGCDAICGSHERRVMIICCTQQIPRQVSKFWILVVFRT